MTPLRRPLIKYFGSKWKGCRYYPAPRFPTIVEPFAGSACYASHYPDHDVWLFDIDPEVADLLQWLTSPGALQVVRTLPTHELPEGFDLRELRDLLPAPAIDLIRRWQRIGHCSCWTVSSWNCRPGMWGPEVIAALEESLPRIAHWNAIELPYHEIPVARIGAATWFVDPPYQPTRGKRGGYAFEDIDYAHLAAWVRSLPGQVIVCEQEGADWLPFRPSHEITGIKRRVHHHKANAGTEMVWLSDWERKAT